MGLFSYLAGGENRRNLKQLTKIAEQVLALEDKYAALSEEELKGQTAVLKTRLAEIKEAIIAESMCKKHRKHYHKQNKHKSHYKPRALILF